MPRQRCLPIERGVMGWVLALLALLCSTDANTRSTSDKRLQSLGLRAIVTTKSSPFASSLLVVATITATKAFFPHVRIRFVDTIALVVAARKHTHTHTSTHDSFWIKVNHIASRITHTHTYNFGQDTLIEY